MNKTTTTVPVIEAADVIFAQSKRPHFVKEHCEILAQQERDHGLVFLVHSKKTHSLGVAYITPDNRLICDRCRLIGGEGQASLTMAAYLLGFEPEHIRIH